MANKKKTIISEALADLKAIQEAAKVSAKDELVKELPNKFNKIYNKKVEESIKESYEDNIEEPVIGDVQNIDNTPEEEVDAREFSLEDIENAFENASDEDEFNVEPNEDEEIRLSFDEIVGELESLDSDESGEGEYDDTQIETNNTSDDEFLPEKNKLNTQDNMIQGDNSYEEETYDVDGTQLAEMMAEIMAEDFEDYDDNYSDDEIEIRDPEADRRLSQALRDRKARSAASQDLSNVDENLDDYDVDDYDEIEIRDPEADRALKQALRDRSARGAASKDLADGEIDENMIQTLSQKKTVGGQYPRGSEEEKLRYALQEKKIQGYIKENQKLLKTINESKQFIKKYDTVMSRYRQQLTEMAIFNTNLSNVNNLLLNEDLALNSTDKSNIVNEFKNLKSIDESTEKYNVLLEGFKATKQGDVSILENKLSKVSTQSSQKQLNEVVEKTAYQKDDHLDKIKRLFKDNRQK